MKKLILASCLWLAAVTAVMAQETFHDVYIGRERISDRVLVVWGGKVYKDQVVAISTDKGLIVIDAGKAPTLTKEYRKIIEQEFGRNDFIYVINTHYHFDHTTGNQVFPEAEIISHSSTPPRIVQFDKERIEFVNDRRANQIIQFENQLKEADPLSEQAQKLRDILFTAKIMLDDYERNYTLSLPTITFSDRMTLDLGDITLKLYYFGEGLHTGDDIIIHCPEEKLLFTGDLFYKESLCFTYSENFDGERQISILDDIFSEENRVQWVYDCHNGRMPGSYISLLHKYMKDVWSSLTDARDKAEILEAVLDNFSYEKRFSYLTVSGLGEEDLKKMHEDNLKFTWHNLNKAQSVSGLLSRIIDEQGIDAAVKMFAAMRKDTAYYNFNELEFSALGDRLLNGRKYEAAAVVFNMIVEMFPDSPDAYFNLATAYMYTGNKELAEKNFKVVLHKNPGHLIARYILNKIDKRLERISNEQESPYHPGEQTGLKGPYLGQKPPGRKAEIFAPGIVSKALALNFSCTFSPDGREFYFNHFMTIMVCRLLEDGWTAPEPVTFIGNYRAHEPHITPDGTKFYFGCFRPTPEGFPKSSIGYGIYVCERTSEGWGEPQYVGQGMFVTTSRDGKVFVTEKKFEGDKEIYAHISRAVVENGHFTGYEPLGGGLANLQADFPRTAHPSISPDGRTILFDTRLGGGIYAAFLDKSGVWSKPVALSEYGFPADAGIADFSPDGKYIFFSLEGDIYWIRSDVVEKLRPKR